MLVVKTNRIGILLVHGIGEQCQFEHLKEVGLKLAKAIEQDQTYGKLRVRLRLNSSSAGMVGATAQTWEANPVPMVIEVESSILEENFEIECHEVWWADIDPPASLGKFLEFCLWGLSLFTIPKYIKSPILSNFSQVLRLPDKSIQFPIYARLEYFLVGMLFVLVLPLLWMINFVSVLLVGRNLRLDVISQYLGKVRLYQRQDGAPPPDLGGPPHCAIRRRLVEQVVKLACSKVDRWYILAHSMGGVVTFNILNEPEQRLPNYLSADMWRLSKQAGLTSKAKSPDNHAPMGLRPPRPLHLQPDDLLSRPALFAKLRGVVTYGAPLRRFANLWPMTMLLNRDTGFPGTFEWFNIVDPTDPVGTAARLLFPENDQAFERIRPHDLNYRAKGFHLLAHTTYLETDPAHSNTLVDQLVRWILWEKPLPGEGKQWLKDPKQIDRLRILSYLVWPCISLIGAFVLTPVIFLLFKKADWWMFVALIVSTLLLGLGLALKPNLNKLAQSRPSRQRLWLQSTSILNSVVLIIGGVVLLSVFYGLIATQIGWIRLLTSVAMLLFCAVAIVITAGLGRWLLIPRPVEEEVLKLLKDRASMKLTVPEIHQEFAYSRPKIESALHKLVAGGEIRQYKDRYFYPSFVISIIEPARKAFKEMDRDTRRNLIKLLEQEYSFGIQSFDSKGRPIHYFDPKENIWLAEIAPNLRIGYYVRGERSKLDFVIIEIFVIIS
jgi:hypothetical protein